jgi:hypothetical protein
MPDARGSGGPNGGHREVEHNRIADHGAGRRRVARVKEIPEDTGLRRHAGDRRLVVVGVPAVLDLVEGKQRLVNVLSMSEPLISVGTR